MSGHDADRSPHIDKADLDEVLAVAAKMQAGKAGRTGPSPVALAAGVALVAALGVFATRGWWGPKLHPVDPVTAALNSEQLRQQALDARFEQDYTKAATLAQQAVDAYPGNMLALVELGLAQLGAKQPDRAEKSFRQAIAVGGTQRDACYAYFNLAYMLDNGPRQAESLALYKQAIARRQDFAPAHHYLGEIYERQGHPDLALAEYEATIQADRTYHALAKVPASYAVRLKRGETEIADARKLFDGGQPHQALARAHTAIKAYPGNSLALRDMGLSPDTPKDADHESHELWRESSHAYKEKLYRKAARLASEAIQLDPDNYDAQNALGMALVKQQNEKAAEEAYRTAIDIGGPIADNYYAFYNLGLLLRRSHRAQEALATFQQVLQIEPTESDAEYWIGRVYEDLQQPTDALAAYRRCLEMAPKDQDAQRAIARLEGGSHGR